MKEELIPLINSNTYISESIDHNNHEIDVKKIDGKAKRLLNLRPFKKGNKASLGKPKGMKSPKQALTKLMKTEDAEAMARDLLNDAIRGTNSGSLQAKKFIFELAGEY